jgi:hypothetical protein
MSAANGGIEQERILTHPKAATAEFGNWPGSLLENAHLLAQGE